jgi:hypothetical protein
VELNVKTGSTDVRKAFFVTSCYNVFLFIFVYTGNFTKFLYDIFANLYMAMGQQRKFGMNIHSQVGQRSILLFMIYVYIR